MPLSPNMEDYLEAIFFISTQKTVVRVKDVSRQLGVTMPSVNGALKKLEARGLIKHEKYENIELTSQGKGDYAREVMVSLFRPRLSRNSR